MKLYRKIVCGACGYESESTAASGARFCPECGAACPQEVCVGEEDYSALLREALFEGSREADRIVEAVLAAGGRPDQADSDRQTALHHASAWARLDLCELLLRGGADPALRDFFGRTPAACYASECDEDDGPAPGTQEAPLLFAAYGGGETPERYFIIYRDIEFGEGKLPGPRQTRASEFFGTVSDALRTAALPGVRNIPHVGGRVAVWLMASEVEQARGIVDVTARDEGFDGEIFFSQYAGAGPASAVSG